MGKSIVPLKIAWFPYVKPAVISDKQVKQHCACSENTVTLRRALILRFMVMIKVVQLSYQKHTC